MSSFICSVIGACPFSFGTWFRPVDDNWPDWLEDAPRTEDYWTVIQYDEKGKPEGSLSGKIRVTGPDLRLAAEKIADGKVRLNRTYREMVRNVLAEPGEYEMDAVAADAVIQVAVYGEVMYG